MVVGELQLNDPVYINQKGNSKPLEGVVAYLGNVQFADGDDWVGVRLTGASVGNGKNDGSVKGHSYFSCPPNGGSFVRKAMITKRTLSKLEELRLRRELAAVMGGSSSSGSGSSITGATGGSSGKSSEGSKTPPRAISPPRATTPPPPPGDGTAPKSKSRLEELRQRRAALTTEKPASTSQQQKQKFDQKLEEKDQQITALQEEVQQLKQQKQQDQEKIQQLQEDVVNKEEELKKEVEKKSAAAAAAATNVAEAGGEKEDENAAKIAELEQKKTQLEEELQQVQQQAETASRELQDAQQLHAAQISKKDTQIMSMQAELRALQDTTSATQQRDASQYKELAKSQAEFSAMKRKYEQVCEEKVVLESNVEDLTLDKDQLQEEKDALEERLEEVKIDAETAQMECEEMRMELENARAAAASAAASAAAARMSAAASPDQVNAAAAAAAATEEEGMAQALATQNARLREALIRLREQSSMEKMELTRQLKQLEKANDSASKLAPQLENMKASQQTMEEQMEDLKDMVEQGAAFEGMVEDLSDRLLSLEEDNGTLRTTVRELEEAAELTAEMEEVQAEELKALYRDLEDRDTIVRNLQEAIKMQRRREEDFSRTLGNYRTMVETLKKEKEALLELQQGGEGEKSSIIASSQKALARAAQLVTDAAEMRKREAQAVMDRIEGQIQRHLCQRLERLVPRSVGATEISAVTGELLACKVAGMASESLKGIAVSFSKTLRVIPPVTSESESSSSDPEEPGPIQLSDESKQEVATMAHQSKCAHVLIDTSVDLLRLLAAGQWPDLLNENASTELGVLLGHSVSDLDRELRVILKSLKEEGVMSPHQSSMGDLQQTALHTSQHLGTDLKEANIPIPQDWNPPGLKLLQYASHAKFSCLGVGAIVASAVKDLGNETTTTGSTVALLSSLLIKLSHLGTESTNACTRLATVNVQNTDVIDKLSDCVMVWKDASDQLLKTIETTFSESSSGDGTIAHDGIVACVESADNVIRVASQFSSALRLANKTSTDSLSVGLLRALSPEAEDIWNGISGLVKSVRKTDGDEEDVNFLFRARSIEQRLSDAVDKEPKLSLANAKVASLEKSLATRSKEIAMQNARLSELEKLLAKTSSRPSPGKKSATLKSSEELNSLKEENRVLMEAMDVLQRQVDEYENEIRVLKDMKTPKKSSRSGPRRAVTSISDYSSTDQRRGGVGGISSSASSSLDPNDQSIAASSAAIGALEAALFRPALQNALRDANRWKGKALTTSLLQLPKLSVPPITNFAAAAASTTTTTTEGKGEEESKTADEFDSFSSFNDRLSMGLSKLSSALSDYRMEQASIQIVSLTSSSITNKTSRTLLRESKLPGVIAAQRLDAAASSVKQCFTNRYDDAIPLSTSDDDNIGDNIVASSGLLLGKLTFQGKEPYRSVSAMVNKEDLFQLQSHLLR